MNKLEQEMIKAIKERRDWKWGNTEVKVCPKTKAVTVYLYGNRIATSYGNNTGMAYVELAVQKHPTRTTASRLRALGFDVRLSKGQLIVES